MWRLCVRVGNPDIAPFEERAEEGCDLLTPFDLAIVRVNTILPGSVMTERRLTMLQGHADTHGLSLDATIEQFAAEVGIARYGQPDDIANAVAFLFTPDSHWITGTALRVDGGETKAL